MTGEVERDWFSKPGDSIKSLMSRKGLRPEALASKLNGGMSRLRALLDGTAAIDSETAESLAQNLAGTTEFWMKRQLNFERALERAIHQIVEADAEEWLSKVPAPGAKPRARISPRDRDAELRRRLVFYNVPTLKTWDARYGDVAGAHFRTSPSFRSERAAVMSWLRQGELEADLIQAEQWNPDGLEQALPSIRALSRHSRPDRFLPKLRVSLADVGVALVVMPTPKGCHASGAARLVAPDKAMILMSFRHRSDDQFWFTLFHEIGHLLLHKGQAFVDEEETPENLAEKQANQFASDCIVPRTRRSEFLELQADPDSIMRFAVSIGVSPGLIVGQMQHQGMIPFGRMERLKRRWTWGKIRPAAGLS